MSKDKLEVGKSIIVKVGTCQDETGVIEKITPEGNCIVRLDRTNGTVVFGKKQIKPQKKTVWVILDRSWFGDKEVFSAEVLYTKREYKTYISWLKDIEAHYTVKKIKMEMPQQ